MIVMAPARRFDHTKLKAARGGLTMRQAASVCGVPLDTYRQYEYGRRVPSADMLAKLAAGLRVSLDALYSEISE